MENNDNIQGSKGVFSDTTDTDSVMGETKCNNTDATRLTQEELRQKQIESTMQFIENSTWKDKTLIAAFAFVVVYGFVLIPLKPYMSIHHPLVYGVLTGGKIPMVIEGATNTSFTHFLLVALIGALSSTKFLPLYYAAGKQWGEGFIKFMFSQRQKPPRWLTLCQDIYRKHPIIVIVATFVPFSPVPAWFVIFFAAINRTSGKLLALGVISIMFLNRLFYILIGNIYGEQVVSTLNIVDKYMMYITLGVVAWAIFVPSIAQSIKLKAQKKGTDDTTE